MTQFKFRIEQFKQYFKYFYDSQSGICQTERINLDLLNCIRNIHFILPVSKISFLTELIQSQFGSELDYTVEMRTNKA